MQELQLLNDKLDVLLKKYALLQAENKRLGTTIAEQHRSLEMLNHKLSLIEHEMTTVHVGRMMAESSEKDTMRKQLDNVISEIDKILNTLND